MSKNMDRRVRKTRAQLRQGLAELLKEKSLKEITVKELVEKVDINRSTFYLHYADIYDIDEEVAGKAMKLAKKLAGHMTEVLGCDGFNILQNNHEVAGQTVFHFHMHLIPRYQNAKNNDILMWSHENFSDEEMAQIRDSLSRN